MHMGGVVQVLRVAVAIFFYVFMQGIYDCTVSYCRGEQLYYAQHA